MEQERVRPGRGNTRNAIRQLIKKSTKFAEHGNEDYI